MSINDVTALGRGGQGFCGDISEAFSVKKRNDRNKKLFKIV